MNRHLSTTARRVLNAIRTEGGAPVADLAEVLGLAEAVVDDAVAELLGEGEIRVAFVNGSEVLVAGGAEGDE